jgi:hypothetical protein
VIEAYGFEPGPRERDHDIGHYMREHIEQKNASTKGTLAYETTKRLMNALIGKLGQRTASSLLLPMERYGRQNGVPGLGTALAKTRAFRGALMGRATVGKLWMPEHGALIVGRARAVMATITAKGSYVLSTDAVIGPPDVDYNVAAGVRQLQAVGSALKLEYEGDALFLARSRLYAILQDVNRIRPDATVLARDERWAVVRVARHGTTESKQQFAETVLNCLAERKDVAKLQTKTRLLSAEASVREGLEINESVSIEGKTYWGWDGKRALIDRDINPFTSSTMTRPYSSLARLEAAEAEREVRSGTRRRKTQSLSAETAQTIVDLLVQKGKSMREIATATGVSKTTVGRLKQRMDAAAERRNVRRGS